ncbi:MAG: mechanosensitive ion channel protein MscS [Sulfurimonas sp. RIFCSPLOWO2_12_FULL_36_74]|nr:MAG: mechanosensitive ion channel protein MscS [Sulfurimonas sp. RIFCSPLOWO2_12_FULL_36_74]
MDISKYTDMAIVYAGEYGLKIVAALAIFFIGKWGVKKFTTLTKKLMLKAELDLTLVEFLENVIYFALLIVIVLASLNALGINTTSFLAVFGAALLIIIFRPFRVGDFIDSASASGTVQEINLFSTIMITGDNKTIIVPNSSIISGNIVNYSNKPTRRIDLIFKISYENDLKLTKDTLMQIMQSDGRVLAEPAPFIAVDELGERTVNLVLRAWVKTEMYWDVRFDMLEKAKFAFDEKGILISSPQIYVQTKKD